MLEYLVVLASPSMVKISLVLHPGVWLLQDDSSSAARELARNGCANRVLDQTLEVRYGCHHLKKNWEELDDV